MNKKECMIGGINKCMIKTEKLWRCISKYFCCQLLLLEFQIIRKLKMVLLQYICIHLNSFLQITWNVSFNGH